MFSAQYIALSFITMLLGVAALGLVQKRKWIAVEGVILAVSLATPAYSVAAGLFLLNGWHDPMASASAQEVGNTAASHGGRGGIVILAVRFWPYILIGLGGYFGAAYLVALKRLLQQQGRA